MLYSETEWTSDVDQTLKKLLEQSRSTLEVMFVFRISQVRRGDASFQGTFQVGVEVVDFQYI